MCHVTILNENCPKSSVGINFISFLKLSAASHFIFVAAFTDERCTLSSEFQVDGGSATFTGRRLRCDTSCDVADVERIHHYP